MKIKIHLFYLVLFALSCSTQRIKKIARQVNRNSEYTLSNDSILLSIQKANDLSIGYQVFNKSRYGDEEFYLLGFHKNNCTAYKYLKKAAVTIGQLPYKLDTFPVSKNNKDSIMTVMKQTKIWALSHDEKAEIYCPLKKEFSLCNISDAETKKIIVMTKSHQTSSDFYAPEYYENCCPGNIDRQRFLIFLKSIDSSFK